MVDPIKNSPNQHHKNCMADSNKNYYSFVESERVKWILVGVVPLTRSGFKP